MMNRNRRLEIYGFTDLYHLLQYRSTLITCHKSPTPRMVMFLTPSSFLHGDFTRVPKTFLTAAPTPAKPEGTESGPRLSRVRPEDERGFELPGDDALRAEGWAKGGIDQGQVLVCEVSSDAAAQMMKSALATHYRDCTHGRELCAAPIKKKRFAKSPLQCTIANELYK